MSEFCPVEVNDLSFHYPYSDEEILHHISFSLPRGSRCLLTGANGSGKTTLLRLLAGKHMTSSGSITTLFQNAFRTDSRIEYLGSSWSTDVAYAGYGVPLSADIAVKNFCTELQSEYIIRRNRIVQILDIDLEWRLYRLSDGQRRRVQIMLGLLYPFEILLLDEITVDLDLLARHNLISFLLEDCSKRNATVIYATHIFDYIDIWCTHMIFLVKGSLKYINTIDNLFHIYPNERLSDIILKWLREEKESENESE